jgi:protein MpaA
VTMFPILNPNGLARGVRTNRDGIDLNRDYRNSRSLETKSHIETLLTLGRFEASMMLHEDYDGIGAYLYELNDTLDPGLGAKIIAAMDLHVPVDLRPEIEEGVARGGSSRGAISSPNWVGLKTAPSGPRRLISRSITPR